MHPVGVLNDPGNYGKHKRSRPSGCFFARKLKGTDESAHRYKSAA
jgi:hypothetical protein